jgi:peroxiredoxin
LAASVVVVPLFAGFGMQHATLPLDVRALVAAETPGGLAPGASVPNFRLTDHRGVTRELDYESTAKAIVLVFTKTGHPRAVQTAAALRALRERFPAGDVVIWQIDANAGTDPALVAAEQALCNNDTPVLIDDAQRVAAEFGASRQLETFVLGTPPLAQVMYRGPLDNAGPATLAAPTEHYAADAVAAILAGRSVPKPRVDLPAAAPTLDLLPEPAIDYAADVAPIIQRRCVSCHSAGNIAPHVYARFEDLSARALQIRGGMLQKRMSPWHADPRFGVFSNGLGLAPGETATLHAWAKAGAPRGAGADPLLAAPAPPGADWPLGRPDLILTIPRQTIPARGLIDYRYITVDVPVTAEKWLRAAVVRPGNPRVVHHALVFEGSQFDLLFAALASGQLPGLGGFFAGYVPGLAQTWFPDDAGKRLRASSQITFQMHYTATGQAETDETQIGFYYYDRAPGRELLTRAATTLSITIPPGAKDYERTATFTPSATKDVVLYELNPHMHYRGKRFRFEAAYPDGTTETLLNVPQYDFAWQSGYRFAEPKRLPRGTVLRAVGAFDNSAQNRLNPDPRVIVTFGEQTNDEMFIGYINYAELPENSPAAAPVFAANTVARARVGEAFALALTATNAPTRYRADALPAGLTLDPERGVISGTPAAAGRRMIAVTAENAVGAATMALDLVVTNPGAPVFTQQPRSVRARLGDTVTLTAAVAAAPGTVYTWYFRGGEFCNTAAPVLTLNTITAAYVGDYACVAANAAGSATSAVASLSLDFSGLVNLSARARVGTEANVVIPGITVRGDKPKQLLIRAVGPGLAAFGVGGILANPTLSVFNAAGEKILVNDNWGDVPAVAALRTASSALGAFALPEGSRDAAMLVTVPPGSYTVQVSGAGTGAAAQGVAIVEVYEADANPSTLVNLSCRARVGTGADLLIAGFTLVGTEAKRVLIRGVGPTLAGLGVAGTLADPRLEIIRQSTGATVASNDNWDAALAPTFAAAGAFALTPGSRDAALVVTLPPGSYTAQVSGTGNATGVAIVEVYELP